MPSKTNPVPTNWSAGKPTLDARLEHSGRVGQSHDMGREHQRHILEKASADYMLEWGIISELATKKSDRGSEPTSGPPPLTLRFQDVPWPLISYTSEIEIYPLTQKAKEQIGVFLTMGLIPELYEHVRMNYEIWNKTDFRETVLPFVIPQDKERALRLAGEIGKMMYEFRDVVGGMEQAYIAVQRKNRTMKYWIPPSRPGVSSSTASGARHV